jgi:hypothetical protein
MNKLSRYILVFITILAAAVALPEMYWLAFEKPINAPFIMYSSQEHDFFMIQRENNETVRVDRQGNHYTRDEFELKLPMFFSRQLAMNGTLPDTLNGIAMDLHEINHARSTFRFRARDMQTPTPGLYPMFESESGRANLEMPTDFFRITHRMEFLDAATNEIDERKSQMFTTVLNNREFNYPTKMIAGIPTTRKSCDEGYFVVDNKEMMYHVKMVKGEPYVRKINVPDGLTFKHISCVDFSDKKYYCYMIGKDNGLWILTQDVYEFVRWPFEELQPETDELRIYGNLFNYTVITRRAGYQKVVALDTKYRKVDEFSQSWPVRSETKQGKIAGFIFPAEMQLSKGTTNFVDLFAERSKGFNWLILNFLLVIGQVLIIRRSRLNMKKNIVDLVIVGVTGIYGFIAVNFFQNKFFENNR